MERIEVGDIWQSRNGEEYEIVSTTSADRLAPKYPILATRGPLHFTFTVEGYFAGRSGHNRDLVKLIRRAGDTAPADDPPTMIDEHARVEALKAKIKELEARLSAQCGEGEAAGDVKEAIAAEAVRIVSGARRGAYGKPEKNFERIALFWQAYFTATGRDIQITAADVSPMMRLMKEARLCETPNHRDSFVDLVGYTLTGAEVNGVSNA